MQAVLEIQLSTRSKPRETITLRMRRGATLSGSQYSRNVQRTELFGVLVLQSGAGEEKEKKKGDKKSEAV